MRSEFTGENNMAKGWYGQKKRHANASKKGWRRRKAVPINKFKVKKYAGNWYEQGSTPQWFSKGCKNTKANYKVKGGKVIVTNSCNTKDGKKVSKGKGYPTDEKGKLEVGFFPSENPIFTGEYNVAHLEQVNGRYKNAIVTSNDNVWILSKSKKISKAEYDRLKKVARQKGIKTAKIKRTTQG